MAILIICLGILALSNNLNIYILFLLQIFISIMDSIFLASSTAILPELAGEEKLMRATSIRGGSDTISMIIGPSIGGIICRTLWNSNSILFKWTVTYNICNLFISHNL